MLCFFCLAMEKDKRVTTDRKKVRHISGCAGSAYQTGFPSFLSIAPALSCTAPFFFFLLQLLEIPTIDVL